MPAHPPPRGRSLALLGGFLALGVRHDVDVARYEALGERFPAVAFVGGLASGTLIAPRWVLTAAHAPESLARMRRGEPVEVVVGGSTHAVVRVVYPPERELEPALHDIALLELEAPVADVAPLALYEEDVDEGLELVLSGHGILATGDTGLALSPEAMESPTRALRAGRNAITRIEPLSALFFARFDAPGDEAALAMEAGPCLGDSGGPALVEVATEGGEPAWRIAGVIAQIDDGDGDRVISEYGEEFGMTLVAAYADWIRETVGEAPSASQPDGDPPR